MAEASESQPTARENYAIGYDDAMLQSFQRRTLAISAPFFISHLRPGMAVLDVGCGPGAITIEIAERVAPGPVVGIDVETGQFALAGALAVERGIENVRFEVGDAYALPFSDASFDAVFSHALISHLGEPMCALAEMRRVLRPGGVAAVAENDTGAFAFGPANSAMERFFALLWLVQAHNGGLRLQPRYLRGALLEAGFARAEAYGSAESFGTPEATRWLVTGLAAVAAGDEFQQIVLREGWASQDELDGLSTALTAWGERPDAFGAALKCGALAWTAPAS